jgi:hypothetical protein
MKNRLDESFTFMEALITTWLKGAHDGEVARILDVIKAELDQRQPMPGLTGSSRPARAAGPTCR